MNLADNIISFFERQSFVIVSTLDQKNKIHCSAKGIVKIAPEGKIYLLDLYKANTFKNLKKNPTISITAVDEHYFIGYTLQGRAKIIQKQNIKSEIINEWVNKIVKRISKRLIKNIKEEKKLYHHPEAKLPNPKYLIEMTVEKIINLTPKMLQK